VGLTLETLLEKSLGLKSEGAMGDMRRRRICLSPLVKETAIRLPKIDDDRRVPIKHPHR